MLKQLKFKKSYQFIDFGVYSEVRDQVILKVLMSLQQKYQFKIISCKIKNCFSDSRIVIWCNKKDWQNICFDFCQKLDRDISDIRF